jgi:hypothetical protein
MAPPARTASEVSHVFASTDGRGQTARSTSTIAPELRASTGPRASTGWAAFTAGALRGRPVS